MSSKQDNIENYVKFFVKIGCNEEITLRLINYYPKEHKLTIENLKDKFNNLLSLGYTNEAAVKIIARFPMFLTISAKLIQKKFFDIIKLGISKDEVIFMTSIVPQILGYNIQNIKDKITYLRKINLDGIYIENPGLLIQSVDLTAARYEFLKEQDIEITKENHIILFSNSREFENRFGITKDLLLEKYGPNKENVCKVY